MTSILTPPLENNGNEPANSSKAACSNKYFFKIELIPAGESRPDFWPEITKDIHIYREEEFTSNYPFDCEEQKLDKQATAEKTKIEMGDCDVMFEKFYANIYSEIEKKIKSLDKKKMKCPNEKKNKDTNK